MCAKDIMQKEVLWGNADDSVQQALTKMQQADVGYMMIGKDGLLDGIVSTFDIAATLSVYLKPMFAKWRRPIDDATLQIKIKWIMTRPVRTIKLDAPLISIMESMCQYGLRCLPVVEKNGKMAGLITVFDIFKALLHNDSDLSTTGNAPQGPPLA
jgi:CBS domain-containing membrane protein